MLLTLDIETDEERHFVTFEGTPNEINDYLRGFFTRPILIHKIILIGLNHDR